MSIRITQGMIYNKYVSQMQTSLGAYMESSEQGSTQKKINRPSDDPAGIYKVLTLRRTQLFNTQLLSNCDTAKGWLKLEDSVLSTQMPTVVTSIKSLAEQAATGTYTAEQRRDIAFQVRQQFGSLLNMANTEFDGKSLFAGHKYNSAAFQQGLALMSEDERFSTLIKEGKALAEGDSETTIAFQFTQSGTLADGLTYRWTNDGGTNWHDAKSTVDGSNVLLSFDGVSVTLSDASSVEVQAANTDEKGVDSTDGTIFIRPAAFYQGDSNDSLEITYMGAAEGTLSAKAEGTFAGNTLVRLMNFINEDGSEASTIPSDAAGTLTWQYSNDNGMNWVTVQAALSGVQNDPVRLPLPEGYLDVTLSEELPKGTQVMIHPEDADLKYEIMKDTYIAVNGVGKDIFGGYYENKPALQDLDSDGRNLFEVVGDFIAYLETNNQTGCSTTLTKLAEAEEHLLTQAARVGGLENRVDVAYDVLTSQKLDIKERLSYVEDIDLTELLVKMEQQQMTYQTVLQSASKILNLSLANYL